MILKQQNVQKYTQHTFNIFFVVCVMKIISSLAINLIFNKKNVRKQTPPPAS